MESTSSRVLTKLSANRTLSRDGRDWLTLALDPYHDYNHPVAGYPDADASQTVVACYQYQQTLASPLGNVGNWDAHIFNSPLTSTSAYNVASYAGSGATVTNVDGDTTCVIGPLTIYASAAGGSLLPTTAASPTTQIGLPNGANANDLTSGITRVIGIGYEVVNTTSNLNKQGSITAYRMPQYPGAVQTVRRNFLGTTLYPVVGTQYRLPPTTVQEAMALKGCLTWEAADGAYVTCAQSTVANPLCNQTPTYSVLTSTIAGTLGSALSGPLTVLGGSVAPVPSVACPQFAKFMPYDTTGLFLTGLSQETTLQVTLKVYIERAPTQATPDLAVLATPSAAYDMAALELYSHAISMLPIAARVKENARGDWWRSVLRVLGSVAGPVGIALNPLLPGAAVLGTGIASGANLAAGSMAQRPRSTAEALAVNSVNISKKKKKRAAKAPASARAKAN